ncbi:hypothetical protein BH10PAT2_BH10PAT2_2000 [soil metagenome]
MKGRQGFASMDETKRRKIARLGGVASGKKRAKSNQ